MSSTPSIISIGGGDNKTNWGLPALGIILVGAAALYLYRDKIAGWFSGTKSASASRSNETPSTTVYNVSSPLATGTDMSGVWGSLAALLSGSRTTPSTTTNYYVAKDGIAHYDTIPEIGNTNTGTVPHAWTISNDGKLAVDKNFNIVQAVNTSPLGGADYGLRVNTKNTVTTPVDTYSELSNILGGTIQSTKDILSLNPVAGLYINAIDATNSFAGWVMGGLKN